jgi:8-oxo-dGTP pyrophosphatase MutT (NUDIX family)
MIERAALRECEEETGIRLAPVRFLFILHYIWEGSTKEFQSYAFLTEIAEGKVLSRDRKEQITAFRDAGRPDIAAVVERLETLSGNWSAWGRFRAAPHRALLQVWPEDLAAIPRSSQPL